MCNHINSGLNRGIIAKKKAEMKDYMGDVKALLTLYVPPDPQKMQAYQAVKFALNPVPGAVNLVFTDYTEPGDRITVTFDTAAKKINSLDINTYMGQAKDAVTLHVQMATLPNGPNYAQQTVLNATAKELVVTTTNPITKSYDLPPGLNSELSRKGGRVKSESCVHKNCAILGVHPRTWGPNAET